MPDRVLGNWLRLVAAALCIAGYVRAADYDRHVFFDSSLSAERHYSSEGKASAPSTLTLLQDRLPVERRVFFTPPNSIRLEWRSQPSGGWEASLKLEAFRNRPLGFQGVSLVLWCFSPKPVPASALPRIQLSDADGAFTAVLEVGP